MKIGIDFGTSFSLPAGLINDNAATLLPGGQYGIPSAFYYDKRQGVVIGKPAAFPLHELEMIRDAAQEEADLKVLGFILNWRESPRL